MKTIKRTLIWSCAIINVILLLFGFLMICALIHEYEHKSQFNSVSIKGKDSICLIKLNPKRPWEITSSYDFFVNSNNEQKFEKIDKYSELKAYSISTILSIFWIASLFYLGLNIHYFLSR